MTPLRRLRTDAGLTAKALALATGVPASTISAVERGGSASPANLKKLADFLANKLGRDVAASELLERAAA
jgi:transcriptional regulator with XRE-family HTH domain